MVWYTFSSQSLFYSFTKISLLENIFPSPSTDEHNEYWIILKYFLNEKKNMSWKISKVCVRKYTKSWIDIRQATHAIAYHYRNFFPLLSSIHGCRLLYPHFNFTFSFGCYHHTHLPSALMPINHVLFFFLCRAVLTNMPRSLKTQVEIIFFRVIFASEYSFTYFSIVISTHTRIISIDFSEAGEKKRKNYRDIRFDFAYKVLIFIFGAFSASGRIKLMKVCFFFRFCRTHSVWCHRVD